MNVQLVSQTQIDKKYLERLMKEVQDDKFIANVQDLEGLIAYVARVSSSKQAAPTYAGLIKYCMKHGHWSILEMGSACFEIQTSRGISPQILRHRSFSFQEFSQRYQSLDETGIEVYAARRQDDKNRQNSIDDLPDNIKQEFEERQLNGWKRAFEDYTWALDNDIAKECARFLLPLGAKTQMYMHGTIRSWVHYVNLRADPATQLEHREIAEQVKAQFKVQFPIIAEASGW